MHTDNGKEYVNNELINWSYEKGLQLELTAPYLLEQNGIAERYNRTLAELVRAMLIARHLPKSLWAAAVYHAAYLHNRAFTRAISNATPVELWTGNKLSAHYLYEFGTPVWVLNENTTTMSKLDPCSTKQLFVRYANGPKAIKYYDIHTHQIKIMHNYRFPTNLKETPQQFEGELTTSESLWDNENKQKMVNDVDELQDILDEEEIQNILNTKNKNMPKTSNETKQLYIT